MDIACGRLTDTSDDKEHMEWRKFLFDQLGATSVSQLGILRRIKSAKPSDTAVVDDKNNADDVDLSNISLERHLEPHLYVQECPVY